ncbi:hypothetical protein S1001342_02546 [Acetobacter pasteurianus subsp. pasteurianus]|uniref:Uncharacterized protein n=1 Tax=Acetobacter pasteurianus subsp. pasteurianus TaxID=481145 RepID=A0A1Y0Y8Q8_ACEPA|nr:hypothetical protein S1001342_02546 [Acetobacter pasteurianus subsp. pasteurianus]
MSCIWLATPFLVLKMGSVDQYSLVLRCIFWMRETYLVLDLLGVPRPISTLTFRQKAPGGRHHHRQRSVLPETIAGDTVHWERQALFLPDDSGRRCCSTRSERSLHVFHQLPLRAERTRRGNLTEGLYIGLDYEKVCFAQKKFP